MGSKERPSIHRFGDHRWFAGIALDLRPLDSTDPAISSAVDAAIAHFRKTAAILCFSRNCDNLLLWSHYGASHRGTCLGFDIPEGDPGANYDTDVLYQPKAFRCQ